MNPLISAALLFAPFVPKLLDFLNSDNAHEVAKKTIEVAQNLTLCDSPEAALMKLYDDENLKGDFVKNMLPFLLSLEALHQKSVDAARMRDVTLASLGLMGSTRRADWMVIMAALGLCVGLFILAFFGDSLSGEGVGIISTISGIFGSCLKDAFGFEFGSSRGSREKDWANFRG